MQQTRLLPLFGATLLLLAPAYAGKLSKDLQNVSSGSTVDVIVQFKQAPTEAHHQKITSRGGQLKTALGIVKGGHYSIAAGKLAELADDPDVSYISPDRGLQGTLDYAASTVGADVALKNGLDGLGVTVAVIDSGVTDHADLQVGSNNQNNGRAGKSRVLYDENFVPARSNSANNVKDEYGHGTHVAGIIAGNAFSSDGTNYAHTFRGMARRASLVNLRVLDGKGAGQDSYVIAAIQRAIALKNVYNIRIINLSLGRPVYESYTTDPLCQAVESAWKAGLVVVVAAGNDGRDNSGGRSGYGTISSPGNDPLVITVGAMKTKKTATRSDDEIASYSSKGPTFLDHVVKPDLVAPGNQIISLLANGNNWISTLYPQNVVPYSYFQTTGSTKHSDSYVWLSGTSMATPMVSGAAALMLQRDPSLTPDQVKARLMKTATKSFPAHSTATDPLSGQTYTSQYDIFTIGAVLPTASCDATTGRAHLVDTKSVVWGESGV